MEFKHTPIMLKECLDGLNIKPDGIYFDGTLGGGGHSAEILKRLKTGRLIATDKDIEAVNAGEKRLKEVSSNFKIVRDDFKNFKKILSDLNIEEVDGVLLDLGVSSHQLDSAERGFSYRFDAELDMRMDDRNPLSAKYIVNNYSQKELERVLFEYGEEPFTKNIVRNILLERQKGEIATTGQLVEIIKASVPKKIQITRGHPAKRVFQALRIEVNGELRNLETALSDMTDKLKRGGRIAVITFHSLEDRIVKNTFKLLSANCICPPSLPFCACNHRATLKVITKKPLSPAKSETEENPRSESAKLRIAEKI